jgi:hypothetical protein
MRTRQVIIPMRELAMMGSGFFVKQLLRGHGLNPDGDIRRFIDKDLEAMVYTEVLEGIDERPGEIREVSAVEGGVRDIAGRVGS